MFENTDLAGQTTLHPPFDPPRGARLGLLAGFFSLLVCLSGCLTPYESGLKELRAGNLSAAEAHARQGLKEQPEDPELNLLLARSLMAKENYRDAEAYAHAAFRSGQMRAEAGRTLGKIQWELDRPVDAAASWAAARAADPAAVGDVDFSRALEAAIPAATTAQRFDKALEFRRALAQLDPDHPEAQEPAIRQTREDLALKLARDGQFEESISQYRALLEDYPANEDYTLAVAQHLSRLDRGEEAIEAYAAYIAASDEPLRVRRMIQIGQRATDPAIAEHFLRRAFAAMPEASAARAELNLNLAAMAFEQGNPSEGRQQLEQYLSDMAQTRGLPLSAQVYITAANLAANHQQQAQAIEILESGLSDAAPNWGLTTQLAGLYTRRARPAEVERVLKTFVERSESSYEARLLVGRWANSRRNFELARHFMERAVEQHAQADASVWLELADIYASLGRTDRLKVALTSYLKSAQPTAQELANVAAAYQKLRLYDEAEKVLHRAIRAEPKSLNLVDALGRLYTEWGKAERITPYYDRWIAARGHKAEDYTLVGQRLAHQGHADRALRYIRKAAERGDHRAWAHIAGIFRNQRRNIDMRNALEQFVATAQDPTQALRVALTYYQSAGMAADEISTLEKLIALEPRQFRDYQQLSELYFNQGREEQSAEIWVSFLSQTANPERGLQQMARSLERSGRPRWVLKVYQRLAQSDFATPSLYRLMGDAHLSMGMRQGLPNSEAFAQAKVHARKYYEVYLEKTDASRTELLDFAFSMYRQQMWDVAADVYERLLAGRTRNNPLAFNYAQSLLKMGRAAEAKATLARYLQGDKPNEKEARKLGEAFFDARLYRDAEPYFDQLMDSKEPLQLDNAFRRLAEIYRSTRRAERLPGLVERYLQRAQNPTKARQEVLGTLRAAGMYAEAAGQIARIRSFQGNVMGLQLAKTRFKAGQFDAAHRAFEEFAAENAYPGEAWVTVADFYAAQGQVDRARAAYEKAVSVAPDSATSHLAHGLFLLLQGELEAGQKALETARLKAARGQREEIDLQAARTLERLGRQDLAARTAQNALKAGAVANKAYFERLLAAYQLATQPPAQAQRTIAQLKKSSVALNDKIDLLVQNGFEAQAGQWLEDELIQGDYYTALQILARHVQILTQWGGFDRLESALNPLKDRSDESGTTHAQIGQLLAHEGEYTRAIPSLQAAMAAGYPEVLPLLAGVYGTLGQHSQALLIHQKYLENTPSAKLPEALHAIGVQYELWGRKPAFIRLLRMLRNEGRYAAAATPLLARTLLQAGRRQEALDLVFSTVSAATEQPQSEGDQVITLNLDSDAQLDMLLGCLDALAAEGYVMEAQSVWAQAEAALPARLSQDPRVDALTLRLAANTSPEAVAAATEDALDQLGKSTMDARKRLQIARLLQITGNFELAGQAARHNLANSDADIYRETAEFLLSNAVASGQQAQIDALAASLVDKSSDPLATLKNIASWMTSLGLDRRALDYARTAAELEPTSDTVLSAMIAAYTAGDKKALEAATDQLMRIDEKPIARLEAMSKLWQAPQDHGLTRPLTEPVQASAPAAFDNRIVRILGHFRDGDVESGRAGLRALLEFVEYDPYAVQQVLAHLNQRGLFVESARVVAPGLQGRTLTTTTQLFLGMAHRHIGMTEEASAYLSRYIEMSAQPVIAASDVASRMLEAGFVDEAIAYADQAIDIQPEHLKAYFYRGAARLRAGQVDAGMADLNRSVGVGVQQYYGLYYAAYHALKGAHDDSALALVDRLVTSPSTGQVLIGASLAIRVFADAERASLGVKFFESKYPQLVAGPGPLSASMVPNISALYDAAGQHERARQIYESALQRLYALDPTGDQTIVYMNNLAYGYSISPDATAEQLARGFDLARRAIAASPTRTPSYLDTLGWLYFKAGKLDPAERYIRGSLRTTDAETSQTGELIDHLIEIEQARGHHDAASWLRVYRATLE